MRLAELATKYGIEAIFYIPVDWHSLAVAHDYEPLGLDDFYWIGEYHEIGSHTITHRHLTRIPVDEAKREILDSKHMLEELLGVQVGKFAPPRGYTNPELTDYTLLYYDSQRLTKEPGLVHIHPNSGANNNQPWRDAINEDTKEAWGHSYDWDKWDMWGEIEDWLKSIS